MKVNFQHSFRRNSVCMLSCVKQCAAHHPDVYCNTRVVVYSPLLAMQYHWWLVTVSKYDNGYYQTGLKCFSNKEKKTLVP